MLQDIVTWKGELYFVDEPTADPAVLDGSLVAFTKNGQLQGIAYRSAELAPAQNFKLFVCKMTTILYLCPAT